MGKCARHAITSEAPLRRAADLLCAAVGSEEIVMLSVAAGRYYSLNAAASRIWELLESPKTVGQLSQQLCLEFEVEAAVCEAEVRTFLDDLLRYGIVQEVAA